MHPGTRSPDLWGGWTPLNGVSFVCCSHLLSPLLRMAAKRAHGHQLLNGTLREGLVMTQRLSGIWQLQSEAAQSIKGKSRESLQKRLPWPKEGCAERLVVNCFF